VVIVCLDGVILRTASIVCTAIKDAHHVTIQEQIVLHANQQEEMQDFGY